MSYAIRINELSTNQADFYYAIQHIEAQKSHPQPLLFGGEGGIRTHEALLPTAFRERHHKPLGHLSPVIANNYTI